MIPSLLALGAWMGVGGPIDHSPEAAYEAFVEAVTAPSSADLFEGGWSTSLGLGGCVPVFGVDYMCVASTSIPGEDSERMFMAIVQPTERGWEMGQIWVYDRVDGLSIAPGVTIEGAVTEAAEPLPECELVDAHVTTVDGSVTEIMERARDAGMDDEGVCAAVRVCTMDPSNPATTVLLEAFVGDNPELLLVLSSICPGMVEETDLSPAD